MANILMCLQLSPVDADQAVELVRLIVALDKLKPANARPEWMVSYRRDTPRGRVTTISNELCERFMTVYTTEASHYANGWPAGSNALWRSTMEDVASIYQADELEAKGVLTFEPDCCPLSLDWIDRLAEAYGMRLQPILGNQHGAGLEATHINGNAIWPVQLAIEWPQMLSTPPETAWDWYHRDFVLQHAEDTPLITQLYRRKNLSPTEWKNIEKSGIRPVLLHGIKDSSARAHARTHLLQASPATRRVPQTVPKAVTKRNLQTPMQP